MTNKWRLSLRLSRLCGCRQIVGSVKRILVGGGEHVHHRVSVDVQPPRWQSRVVNPEMEQPIKYVVAHPGFESREVDHVLALWLGLMKATRLI